MVPGIDPVSTGGAVRTCPTLRLLPGTRFPHNGTHRATFSLAGNAPSQPDNRGHAEPLATVNIDSATVNTQPLQREYKKARPEYKTLNTKP